MSETSPIDQALADAREFANALQLAGNEKAAARAEQIVTALADATEDVRRFVSEKDALLASGMAERTLRRKFVEWTLTGHARYGDRGQREYRLDIVRRKPGQAREIRARVRRRLGKVA